MGRCVHVMPPQFGRVCGSYRPPPAPEFCPRLRRCHMSLRKCFRECTIYLCMRGLKCTRSSGMHLRTPNERIMHKRLAWHVLCCGVVNIRVCRLANVADTFPSLCDKARAAFLGRSRRRCRRRQAHHLMAHHLILGWTVLRSDYSLPHFGHEHEHERDIIVIIAMIYVHVVFVRMFGQAARSSSSSISNARK